MRWRHTVPAIRFGAWRAAQQTVRPATLAATRTLIVVGLSTAAFGRLEAARVYTAPAMLVVNGIGGFLFASYAADRHRGLRTLIRRADIGVAMLLPGVLLVGVAAVLLNPWLGPLISGNDFALAPVAVFGWALYAAVSSAVTAYGMLAAVAGRHVIVFLLRFVEMGISCAAVAVAVFVMHLSATWMPYALTFGAAGYALIVRQQLLVPHARREVRAAATPVPLPVA
jgi:hypothetical protein